jgi:hypothetical protein
MTSRYTNAVLTVIAACLLVLVFRPVFEVKPAFAQPAAERAATGAAHTATLAADGVLKVNIVEIGGWELLSRSALPVEIESGPVPVRLEGASACGCP